MSLVRKCVRLIFWRINLHFNVILSPSRFINEYNTNNKLKDNSPGYDITNSEPNSKIYNI